jgi:ankyrin repeat protein
MMKLLITKWSLVGLILFTSWGATAGSYEDFFAAIKQDDTKTLTTLLFREFDPNTLDPDGVHGLCLALREGSIKVADLLLSLAKTKIEVRTAQDENALMFAALGGHEEILKTLIRKGADVNKTGWTPLHYAATRGHVNIIKLLLEKHAYIDAESPNKTTPLMMAALYGTFNAVKLLTEEGADVLLKNEQGMTALDFAVRGKRPDSTAYLAKLFEAKRPKGSW